MKTGEVPVFDMPVEIANPDEPLGTHVFTALEVLDGGAGMRWNALSIAGAESRTAGSSERKQAGRSKFDSPLKQPLLAKPPSTAAQALDRIKLPQEAIDRVSEILIPGSSLVVSDYGLGGETGRYTDFIVLTH